MDAVCKQRCRTQKGRRAQYQEVYGKNIVERPGGGATAIVGWNWWFVCAWGPSNPSETTWEGEGSDTSIHTLIPNFKRVTSLSNQFRRRTTSTAPEIVSDGDGAPISLNQTSWSPISYSTIYFSQNLTKIPNRAENTMNPNLINQKLNARREESNPNSSGLWFIDHQSTLW